MKPLRNHVSTTSKFFSRVTLLHSYKGGNGVRVACLCDGYLFFFLSERRTRRVQGNGKVGYGNTRIRVGYGLRCDWPCAAQPLIFMICEIIYRISSLL